VSPWLKDELKKVATVTLLMSLGLSNDFFSCQTLHLAELSPDDRIIDCKKTSGPNVSSFLHISKTFKNYGLKVIWGGEAQLYKSLM
jgi:hypothetical protein